MMKYAVFGDVHSNGEALKTFLRYIDSIPDIQPICLGDTVGYASCPNECLEMLLDRKIPMIMGNHDKAIQSMEGRMQFNPLARTVIEWQSQILLPGYRKVLSKLPFTLQFHDWISITHGDFSKPEEFRYVFDVYDAVPSMNAMKTPIGFFGHTHFQAIFVRNPDRPEGENIACQTIRTLQEPIFLNQNAQYLINPGSIGQPRDGEPLLSFVIFDTREYSLTFYRLEYDHIAESQRVLNLKLPQAIAERILFGL